VQKIRGVALLALVLLRVDVQLPGLVDHRSLDGLSRGAVDAAHDDVHGGTLDELRRYGFRHVVVGGAVLDEQLDGATEKAATGVDVIDHHLGDVGIGDAHEGKRAGLIGDEADPRRTVDRGSHRRLLTPGRSRASARPVAW
jgi:hypothetical protein